MYSGSTGYREKISRLINWGHWFTFVNILLSLLIALRYFSQLPAQPDLLGQIYLYCTWLGHFAFLCFAGYLLTLFPLTLLIPNSAAIRISGILIATLGLTILSADAYLFGRYGFHLNLFFVDLIIEDGEFVSASLKTWLAITGSIITLFVIECILAQVIWHKLKNYKQRQIGFWVAAPLMVAFIASHLMHVWADAFNYRGITQRAYLFPLANPTTAKTMLESYGLLPQEGSEIEPPELAYSVDAINCSINEQSNDPVTAVVLITVDGLRFSSVVPRHMPATYQLAQSAVQFRRHHTGGNQVAHGEFATQYSLPPVYQPAAEQDQVQPVLQHIFTSADFSVADYALSAQASEELRDWQQWFNSQEQPTFSQLHLDGPKLTPGPDAVKVAQYQRFLAQVDQQISDVLATIAQSQHADSALVMVTGTVGYELNDTNSDTWGIGSNYSRWQIQVPLIVQWPGMEPARIQSTTSHYDLVPTFMNRLLSCSATYRNFSVGRDLFERGGRDHLVIGASDTLAIVESDRTTVIAPNGNYQIRDREYETISNARLRMSTVLKAIHETKRYNAAPGKRTD